MKRLNKLEKTVGKLAGALERDKEDNRIPVKIKGHEVKLPPLQALSFLERQGGDEIEKIEEKYEERIKELREELKDVKGDLEEERRKKLEKRIDDLRKSLKAVRESKPDERKLVKEAAKHFKTGRTPYDLMDKFVEKADKRAGQILSKITLPSPPQEKPPQLGRKKSSAEERAERMKRKIQEGKEERKLENEFLETV